LGEKGKRGIRASKPKTRRHIHFKLKKLKTPEAGVKGRTFQRCHKTITGKRETKKADQGKQAIKAKIKASFGRVEYWKSEKGSPWWVHHFRTELLNITWYRKWALS